MNPPSIAREEETRVPAIRHMTAGSDPTALASIYEEDCNIALWKRRLNASVSQSIARYLSQTPSVSVAMTVAPERALSAVQEALGDTALTVPLSEDIAELVDMFCCLFGLDSVGLRLRTLDRAMCPRFHVDKVPCRLVTTYLGAATEWLPHECVDRTRLGQGNQGLPDEASGLYDKASAVRRLTVGDVALIKGESWEGNENAGLVHRSPAVAASEQRLLLTLDFN